MEQKSSQSRELSQKTFWSLAAFSAGGAEPALSPRPPSPKRDLNGGRENLAVQISFIRAARETG